MIDNEQLTVLLILFVGFICLVALIRLWPLKKEEKKNSVLIYLKLKMLTGEITELSELELRKDVAVLTALGYEMALLTDLTYFTENNIRPCKKMFLIFTNTEPNQYAELITKQLIALNADVIFYKPVIVKQ
ncbi:MAG: hypothetical protein JST86_18380 [Bacteroidetes bacterium]|nr:hypothetical protein [Bacteroidota bacterium]